MIYFNLQNISIHTFHVISQILLRDSKLFFSVILFSAVGESCSYMKVEKFFLLFLQKTEASLNG